ncbi:MAG: prolyl aminopeptidase [Chromatiales bacterium]|nr:prolyl aminopeptidase [Chromatiales bacterium]
MPPLELHPDILPYRSQRLPVDGGHELHVEECGNPQGLPAVFLHGGPGSGCEPWHRRFFDPAVWRLVLFDQRGAGRSTPHAGLEANTTWDLVADMERIRETLGIERWLLFGGSWGSTLALAYAQRHPERVLGLILRGIFLCRERDLRWFYQDGASHLFPDYWRDYLAPIPEDERHDLMVAYHRRLTGDDEIARMAAARAWSEWEGRTATLYPSPAVVSHFRDPHVALSLARIECHYFVNDAFLEPGQLLRDAGRLRDIPGVIVHGRYDAVCPVEQAFALHEVWPEARLEVVPDAGHSAAEPGIRDALLRATREMAERLGSMEG